MNNVIMNLADKYTETNAESLKTGLRVMAPGMVVVFLGSLVTGLVLLTVIALVAMLSSYVAINHFANNVRASTELDSVNTSPDDEVTKQEEPSN